VLILPSPPTHKKIQEMPDFDSSCQAWVILPNGALFRRQTETLEREEGQGGGGTGKPVEKGSAT